MMKAITIFFQWIVSLFKNKKPNYSVYDIFTPTEPAKYTFVERANLTDELIDAIETPGKQIIVYGHSGSGKSTLLINTLEKYYDKLVISRCTRETTSQALIKNAYDDLNIYYIQQVEKGEKFKLTGNLTAEAMGLSSSISGEREENMVQQMNRMITPQYSIQKLAQLIKKANYCWIIEDFHKVPEKEKSIITENMKVFVDEGVKIAAIGAVATAREVILYNSELQNRISEIEVPLMTELELKLIIEKGEKLLNISLEKGIKYKIIHFSSGLASVCHQLCLNICKVSGIDTTLSKKKKLGEKEFNLAINRYINHLSDTLKMKYDKAIKYDETYNLPELILKNFLKTNKDELSKTEIINLFKKPKSTKKSTTNKVMVMKKSSDERINHEDNEIIRIIDELSSEKRGQIFRFDNISNKYSFTDPFFIAYINCIWENKLYKNNKFSSHKIIINSSNVAGRDIVIKGNSNNTVIKKSVKGANINIK